MLCPCDICKGSEQRCKKVDYTSPEYQAKQFAAEYYCYPEAEKCLDEKLKAIENTYLRTWEIVTEARDIELTEKYITMEEGVKLRQEISRLQSVISNINIECCIAPKPSIKWISEQCAKALVIS